jgi:hypothetical protein
MRRYSHISRHGNQFCPERKHPQMGLHQHSYNEQTEHSLRLIHQTLGLPRSSFYLGAKLRHRGRVEKHCRVLTRRCELSCQLSSDRCASLYLIKAMAKNSHTVGVTNLRPSKGSDNAPISDNSANMETHLKQAPTGYQHSKTTQSPPTIAGSNQYQVCSVIAICITILQKLTVIQLDVSGMGHCPKD